MHIRNRTSDIAVLRCHICQDFLKMIVTDNWQETLYKFVQDNISGQYKNNYIEQYKIIRSKGIENYSIDDMDVPFIAKVLQYAPQISAHKLNKSTLKVLSCIKEDRNATNHSSENESDEELYLRSLISLRDLSDFIHTVDLYETAISDEARSIFTRKYSKELTDLKLIIYNDCIETFQIERDIQLIKASENQTETFQQIHQSYIGRRRLDDTNRNLLNIFEIKAANSGIKDAYGYAEIYCEYILHDFDKAAYWYEKMIRENNELNVQNVRQLICSVNHACEVIGKPPAPMMDLIKLVKNQGFEIEEASNGMFLVRS